MSDYKLYTIIMAIIFSFLLFLTFLVALMSFIFLKNPLNAYIYGIIWGIVLAFYFSLSYRMYGENIEANLYQSYRYQKVNENE